jgi:hypothetical protein
LHVPPPAIVTVPAPLVEKTLFAVVWNTVGIVHVWPPAKVIGQLMTRFLVAPVMSMPLVPTVMLPPDTKPMVALPVAPLPIVIPRKLDAVLQPGPTAAIAVQLPAAKHAMSPEPGTTPPVQEVVLDKLLLLFALLIIEPSVLEGSRTSGSRAKVATTCRWFFISVTGD